jgi:DNA-binding NtrC family response regulator
MMNSQLVLNEEHLNTLNAELLSNLDETLFFTRLSKAIKSIVLASERVEVYEALHDGQTELISVDGKDCVDKIKLNKGKGLSGYVVRTKRPYYSNSKRDPLLADSKRPSSIECELCIPIMADDIVLGTIHIQSEDSQRQFSDKDAQVILELLKTLEKPIANMKIYLIAKNLNYSLQALLNQKEKEQEKMIFQQTNSASLKSTTEIDLIGHSKQFVSTIELVKKVAKEDYPVHLIGENGVGKKSIAKKIHHLSSRKDKGLEFVYCSSLDEVSLEVELFGRKDRPGAFERANGGTIVLDSLQFLTMNLQTKILRAMITGEILVSDTMDIKPINVRIISISKQPLNHLVKEGKFREDLIYRLSLMSIEVPSLKNRGDDIKLLAEHFLNKSIHSQKAKMLTSAALEKLNSYQWPGNIQELRSVMERISLLVDDLYIDVTHLPDLVNIKECEVVQEKKFEEMTLHDLEKIHICRTLDFLGGNKTKAAKSLGITVKTLYNKLHSYGLVSQSADS